MFSYSYAIIAFLAAFTTAANLSGSNLSLPLPHMVIVGPTGAGKSSLAMALVGEDVMCTDCTFPICHDSDSCTNETNYASAPWLGKQENPNFTIVDTPGFGDSDGKMDVYLDEMLEVLKQDVQTANAIILTLDSTEARFNEEVTNMIKALIDSFGAKMWNNTIIEMSKFPYDNTSINNREYDCQHTDLCHDEAYYKTAMNEELNEKFHVGYDLPVLFIDSWAQKGANQEDELQQDHFNEETQKLWDFANAKEPFPFKGMDEILEENNNLRNAIISRNGEIRDSILKLQKKDQELGDDIMKMMPVGSIVAWVPKPARSGKIESDIPEGWLVCNGSEITDGIWKGSKTPNLGNDFLRGGNINEYLTHEDFAMQDLMLKFTKGNEIVVHSHTFHTQYHEHGRCKDSGGGVTKKLDWGKYWNDIEKWDDNGSGTAKDKSIRLDYSGIKLTQNEYRKDSETRPINSYVIWIIRVQ